MHSAKFQIYVSSSVCFVEIIFCFSECMSPSVFSISCWTVFFLKKFYYGISLHCLSCGRWFPSSSASLVVAPWAELSIHRSFICFVSLKAWINWLPCFQWVSATSLWHLNTVISHAGMFLGGGCLWYNKFLLLFCHMASRMFISCFKGLGRKLRYMWKEGLST